MSRFKFGSFVISALLVMVAATSAAFAQNANDGHARAWAAGAQSQAKRAEIKADQAIANAAAVGTSAGQSLAAKATELDGKIVDARKAAASGNGALSRQINNSAAQLRREMDEILKRTQHECAAFPGEAAQKACLNAVKEISNKKEDTKQHEVSLVIGHADNLAEKLQAIALGCAPDTTNTAEGVSQMKYGKCTGPTGKVEFSQFSKYGSSDMVFTPTSIATAGFTGDRIDDKGVHHTSKVTKALVVMALTLGGTGSGGGIGYGVVTPGDTTGSAGQNIHHGYEGVFTGAAIGGGTGLVGGLIWAAFSE